MAVIIDGKVYRNLQEQVEKNMKDIEDLQEHGTGQTYTAGYGITFDETNEIAIDTEVVATKNDILEYESGDGILITTSGDNLRQISVSSDVAMKSDLPIANPTVGELDNPIQLEHLQVGEYKYWIPTDTSDLTNNAGFITIADVPVPTAGTGINITNGQISVDNTVAMKSDIPDTYTKTEIDNKDAATLNSAKAYTDTKVIAGASVYEYELVFDESDNEDTWSYRFISTDPGLINTSVPETYAELVQFVQDYGLHAVNLYKLVGYAVDNGYTYYSTLYYNTMGSTLKVTFPGRADQTIDASNLITNSINLYKRTC